MPKNFRENDQDFPRKIIKHLHRASSHSDIFHCYKNYELNQIISISRDRSLQAETNVHTRTVCFLRGFKMHCFVLYKQYAGCNTRTDQFRENDQDFRENRLYRTS